MGAGAEGISQSISLKYEFGSSFFGVKIFSPIFIRRYKDLCRIKYIDKLYDLEHQFVKNKKRDLGDILEIELKTSKIDKITDLSNMFSGCKSLLTITNINWDTSKVTNMSHMFNKC